MTHPYMTASLLLTGAISLVGCSRDRDEMTPRRMEEEYGISGARKGEVMTSDGSVRGTLVPITLPNGRTGQLVVPSRDSDDPHAMYLQDDGGLHPVEIDRTATREDFEQAPAVVGRHAEPEHHHKRSWEKDALIVGGSAGGGALIGGLAKGAKGAGVGAAVGGVGGLIYDLTTRK
jgi:hypothetical protein